MLNPRTGSRKSPWKLGGQEPALLPPACSESLVASRAVGGRWGHSTESGDRHREASTQTSPRGTALPVSTPPPPAPLHSVTHDYMTFKAGELCMTSLRGDHDVPRDNPSHRAIRHEPPSSGCWQVNRRARAPCVGSAVPGSCRRRAGSPAGDTRHPCGTGARPPAPGSFEPHRGRLLSLQNCVSYWASPETTKARDWQNRSGSDSSSFRLLTGPARRRSG